MKEKTTADPSADTVEITTTAQAETVAEPTTAPPAAPNPVSANKGGFH